MLEDASLTLIETVDDALDFMDWLGGGREFLGFDLETTGLNLGRDRVRLAQFGDPRHGWAMAYDDWKGLVREVFRRYDRPVVAHNLIFDDGFMIRDGVQTPQHLMHDTMIMAHLLDSRSAIGLKPLSTRHVDRRAQMGQGLLREAFQKGGWSWSTIPADHPSYWVYSALDTVLTSMLATELYPRVQALCPELYEIELACIRVLRNARLAGMRVDLDYSAQQRAVLIGELAAITPQIPFTPSKDRELIEYLRGQGAQLTKTTEKGNVSVDDDVLKSLEPYFPVAGLVRQWRAKTRLKTAYFENFLGMSVNQILRCNIKPVGARTGRMSITEPALQTIPRGPYVRDAFIARDDHKLIAADYSGAEMRVMASYANEENMLAAYARGEDVHLWTAQQIYGDHITKESPERQLAKNVGFAKIYGAGDDKIAFMTGSSPAVVAAFQARYAELFPRISQFMGEVINAAKQRKQDEGEAYVTTVLGRRLLVDSRKMYTAVNYLIQSSATADVLKLKLIELDNAGLGPFIRLPVHDEVIFEVPDNCVPDAVRIIEDVMPERRLFKCPLEIEYDVVGRWGDKYR